MCILYVYTLLKVVGYYDLLMSVPSISVMGFQKKSVNGVGEWVSCALSKFVLECL